MPRVFSAVAVALCCNRRCCPVTVPKGVCWIFFFFPYRYWFSSRLNGTAATGTQVPGSCCPRSRWCHHLSPCWYLPDIFPLSLFLERFFLFFFYSDIFFYFSLSLFAAFLQKTKLQQCWYRYTVILHTPRPRIMTIPPPPLFRAPVRVLLQVGEYHRLNPVPEIHQERLQRWGERDSGWLPGFFLCLRCNYIYTSYQVYLIPKTLISDTEDIDIDISIWYEDIDFDIGWYPILRHRYRYVYSDIRISISISISDTKTSILICICRY